MGGGDGATGCKAKAGTTTIRAAEAARKRGMENSEDGHRVLYASSRTECDLMPDRFGHPTELPIQNELA
jgi:hypothetical protein